MDGRERAMTAQTARSPWKEWAGVLTGPTVFLIQLEARYALVSVFQPTRYVIMAHLITALSLAATALTLWVSYREMQATSVGDEDPRAFGARFLAILGVFTSALFFLVIAANALPALFLGTLD
jgi:hypothetical protein